MAENSHPQLLFQQESGKEESMAVFVRNVSSSWCTECSALSPGDWHIFFTTENHPLQRVWEPSANMHDPSCESCHRPRRSALSHEWRQGKAKHHSEWLMHPSPTLREELDITGTTWLLPKAAAHISLSLSVQMLADVTILNIPLPLKPAAKWRWRNIQPRDIMGKEMVNVMGKEMACWKLPNSSPKV